ncbi:site-specific integrase [Polycladomyces sp. WAk]|uniref:Site-specific integrase n=1 Tax=Polycladomyces zharkentensis TaxID=2807616 RepID=A0ABS2WL12_9BACL|nr:site-specific integrase [Polycladomyces sp. WAk]MBN2910252.1 site-specific integrase [Polycladomyces sp. WAk]
MAKVQRAIESEKNEWKRARNFAIFMFMLKAGLRISEVRDLDVAAVDERYWRVTQGKVASGVWFR